MTGNPYEPAKPSDLAPIRSERDWRNKRARTPLRFLAALIAVCAFAGTGYALSGFSFDMQRLLLLACSSILAMQFAYVAATGRWYTVRRSQHLM